MSYPLIMLAGPAGSGKDTVAGILGTRFGAVSVAQADPMKRFCALVFGFNEQQLWGPSENRDACDPLYHRHYSAMPGNIKRAKENCREHYSDWLDEILPVTVDRDRAEDLLDNWFAECSNETFKVGLSPRRALQLLGTEFGRALSRDIWVNAAIRTATQLLGGGHSYAPSTGITGNLPGRGPSFVAISDGRFRNELAGVLATNGETWRIVGRTKEMSYSNHTSETELASVPQHYFTAQIDNSGSKDDLVSLIDSTMCRKFGVRPL